MTDPRLYSPTVGLPRRVRGVTRSSHPRPSGPLRSRVVYAAAHVVADPSAGTAPGGPARLDWEATLAFRHHLWSYGLGVADAMDTAQRGMGLDWAATRELIRRSGAEAATSGGLLACGAGTDQLTRPAGSLADVIAAYEEQIETVEAAGARVILMASRALAAVARSAEDYHAVYGRLLEQVSEPVILHWLGSMFDPALDGYWGSTDLDQAAEVCLRLVREHADAVDGIKVSLLDADREIALRRGLPAGVRLYTGDDLNYPRLIRGDARYHSDALLGIFGPIAPAASAAVQALDAGDLDAYDRILTPTVPLAREVFRAPAYYYKTGIVFLAWLAGHQDHFTMLGGLESVRSLPHLAQLFVLAGEAGLFDDPELATARMRQLFAAAGMDQ